MRKDAALDVDKPRVFYALLRARYARPRFARRMLICRCRMPF